jgi:hypothetical protein
MKYKYKDHYNREYNFLVRARFSSVDTAYQFSWENEDLAESEQERHAEDWLILFVKTKSDLYKLFKRLTENETVEFFELFQK